MRPGAGYETTSSRSRKQSDTTDRPHLTPTTFFLTRDPDSRSPTVTNRTIDNETFPVKSLKDTLEEADWQATYPTPRPRPQDTRSNSQRRSIIRLQAPEECRTDGSVQLSHSSQGTSGRFTPPIYAPRESSLLDSPKSISSPSCAKFEDEATHDETSSQAITSSEDEQEDNDRQDATVPPEVQDSAPQLIMPSIKMPSRRPFTDRGKQLGRFKILVTGSKGSGRTSLIKSIVQLCEDIVHVDSIVPNLQPSPRERSPNDRTVITISEIYASTKPYPFWWSDLDESRILKRRKSVGDAVLERNICFVDTSNSGRTESIMNYLEQQLIKSINAINQAGNDFTGLLSGRGAAQVDVILYLLTKENIKDDCINIRRMSQLSNVIPVISKADLLAPDSIAEMKSIDLSGVSLPRLPFESLVESHSHQASAPYCVSSASGSDFDTMDASLLMSPEYVRPLVPSELALLTQQLFEPTTVSYLRHMAAKKLVAWYATEPKLTQLTSPSLHSPQPSTLNSPPPTSLSNSGILVPVTSELSLNTSNSYALAKVTDHAQREEHLAQIRLSKWASDLQLSLQRERERYEHLARSERALWLVQRMGEEVRDGQVTPLRGQAMVRANEKVRVSYSELSYEVHDPLGLLRWHDTVRMRGWAALQIIGSFGVVGGVALWLAKTWGFTTSLHTWVHDWSIYVFGTGD